MSFGAGGAIDKGPPSHTGRTGRRGIVVSLMEVER